MNHTKLIIGLTLVSYTLLGQRATEKGIAYTVDTAQLNQLNIYMEALKEKSVGNSLEALKLFNYCTATSPKNASAYYEASKIEAELSNFPDAKAKAEKAYSLDKNNKYFLENYTDLLTKTGDIETALDVMKEVISNKKGDDILKMQYAYLLSMSKNPKKAIAILDEFERNGEYNEAIAYEKIKIYIEQKDFKNAENELKKMVKNNPNDTRFLGNLAEFYLKTGNIEQAEKAFNDILRTEPNNVNALLYKVQYYQLKKDEPNVKKAIMTLMYNKDLNLDTKVSLIADKFAQGNKLDSTEKIFLNSIGRVLIAQYPTEYRSHQIMGDMYYMSQKFDSARVAYKKALSIDSKEYDVWQNLFYAQNALKLYQELADSTEAGLELFPANPTIHFYNGIANSQLNKYDKAEKSYKRSLRFSGDNKNLEAQLYSLLGDIYQKQKKYTEMDQSFESAIKLDPDNAYTLNNFAYYLSLRKDKLEYAKLMSKKSLDLDKENSSFLDTYAWINFQLEKYEEAKFYQELALKHGKEDMTTIYEHFGDILIKLNDTENALKYWNKAKEAGSKNKSLSQKISTKQYVDYKD
jgi:tetratricopeptide (TPR) repeat protein